MKLFFPFLLLASALTAQVSIPWSDVSDRPTTLAGYGITNANVTGTTASTSPTTGALIVAGGAGISGALNVGSDIVAVTGAMAVRSGSTAVSTFSAYRAASERWRKTFTAADGMEWAYIPTSATALMSMDQYGAFNVASNRISIGTASVSDTDTFLTLQPQTSGNSIYHLSNATGVLRFSRGAIGSESAHDMTVDANIVSVANRLIVGAVGRPALTSASGISPAVQIGSTATQGALLLQNLTADSAAPAIFSGKNRSGTWGVYTTATQANDTLFAVTGEGADGVSALRRGGIIQISSEGLFTASSSPGWIGFSTTPVASVTPVERVRINSSGNVLFGTATDSSNGKIQLASHTTEAGGIGFGTDTNLYRSAANTLKTDDALAVASTTASTSTTTGALTVAGGVGVTGDIYAKNLVLADNNSIRLDPYTASTIDRLDFIGQTTNYGIGFSLIPNGTNTNAKVAVFNQGSLSAAGTAYFEVFGGNAYIGPQTIGVPTTPVTNLYLGGGGSVVTHWGSVIVPGTTASTSPTTGAFTVTGGVGISGANYIGGLLNVAGTITTGVPAGSGTLTVGTAAPSGDGVGVLNFITSNTYKNWRVSSNVATAENFEITPSTATGGSTFTTPVFKLTAAGGLTLKTSASSLTVEGNAEAGVVSGSIVTYGGIYTGKNISAGGGIYSRSATLGIGYSSGAGGASGTQATSKSTGVALNNVCGTVTMNAASLAANTAVGFTFTNSTIAATDVIIVNIKSGATADAYHVQVDAVAAGSCRISLRNMTGGALAESVVLSFAVIKSVTS